MTQTINRGLKNLISCFTGDSSLFEKMIYLLIEVKLNVLIYLIKLFLLQIESDILHAGKKARITKAIVLENVKSTG